MCKAINYQCSKCGNDYWVQLCDYEDETKCPEPLKKLKMVCLEECRECRPKSDEPPTKEPVAVA